MGASVAVERWPEAGPVQSPRTLVRLLLFLLSLAGGWLLLFLAFPPGAPDRLPVLAIGLALALVAASRPDRGLVAFAFLSPCAGLLARAFSGTDPGAWTSILLASAAAGWCFRFIYDFDSVAQPSALDRPLSRLLAVWVLATLVAVARAETLWAALHGLSGRAVNGEGLREGDAIRESVLALAALAGGAIFFLLLRRSEDATRRRVLDAAILGVSLSAAGAALQKMSLLPAETKPLWKLTGRVAGGAADPNSLGLLCGLALVAGAARGLAAGGRSSDVGRAPRRVSVLLLALPAAGLLLSGSRSGLLILLASLPLAALAGGRRLRRAALALALVVAIGAVLLLLRGSSGTVAERIAQSVDPAIPLEYRVSARPVLWRAAWALFREHLIEGGGMGAFAWRFPDLMRLQSRRFPARDNPGSGYVQALAETGALGLLVTLLFAGTLAVSAVRRIRQSAEDPVRGAAAVAVGAFLAALCLGSHWLAPDVAVFFFLLVSLTASRARPTRPRPLATAATAAVLLYAAAAALAILDTARPDETFRYSPRIGFHEREIGPGGPFTWTRRRFALWVNPGQTVRLGLALFTPENHRVELEARADGHLLYRRRFAPGDVVRVAAIGARDRASAVVFILSRGFVPKRLGLSGDRRELGLQATFPEP